MTAVTRPALHYYGAKWRLAPWILSYLPPHTCYVEPYGGSMGVLLRKAPAEFDVYNDLDRSVVNFFTMLRERPDALIRAILLTPFSLVEFQASCVEGADPLEEARRFYVRCWQGFHPGRQPHATGWRRQRITNRHKSLIKEWNEVDHLDAIIDRLKFVHLECRPALDVIASYDAPTTLFYVDPPYVAETRDPRWGDTGYRYDMTEADHRALAEVLHGVAGKVVLSGYPSALYDALYDGWTRVARRAHTNGSTTRTEQLWLSPACDVPRQLRLEERS